MSKKKKPKIAGNWIRIGNDYINKNMIESVDYRGRWVRTSRTHLVPRNQWAKILRLVQL